MADVGAFRLGDIVHLPSRGPGVGEVGRILAVRGPGDYSARWCGTSVQRRLHPSEIERAVLLQRCEPIPGGYTGSPFGWRAKVIHARARAVLSAPASVDEDRAWARHVLATTAAPEDWPGWTTEGIA